MKGSMMVAGRPLNKRLRKVNCDHLITEHSHDDTFLTGSFYIPPTPQKSSSFPVQKLINYLTRHRDNLDSVDAKKLDLIAHDITSKSDDSELLRILKYHGWNGFRFSMAEDRAQSLLALLQELSNLYLKQKSNFFANRITEIYGTGDSSAFSQLASFSPNLLLHHLSERAASAPTARSFSISGACMLVDISGFSKFSGSMCLQGVNGLDGLREITNGFLGHFVHKVYEYDGDVIAFAGDALICVFRDFTAAKDKDGDSPPPVYPRSTSCSYRALECACSLRSHRNEHLSTHIAVSHGQLSYAVLGGVNDQWVGVMNGQCVSDLSDAITLAGSQEVVATESCLQHALAGTMTLSDDAPSLIDFQLVEGSTSARVTRVRPFSCSFVPKPGKLRDTFKRTASRIHSQNSNETVLIEQLTGFVPRTILSAVYSGALNHIGELRQVTTLFLSLDSYSPSINADPLSLESFVHAAQQVLVETGGFLRQFLVDDKGCVFIAMWGTPSYTYSNNCSRALHCAVKLRERTRAIQHDCSIGITTGIVFCGCVGTPQRRDYVGIGSDVNMAARLMSKAHGRILVDESTTDNLDDATKQLLEKAEEMHLKGAVGPLTPFQYISDDLPSLAVLDAEASRNQLLKRNVMALIAKRLDVIGNEAATKDTTHFTQTSYSAYFTVLLAPLGNGNFAAEYFRHCARKRGIQCYSVSAHPSYKHTPYNVIKQIFLELVGQEHFVSEQQQRFVIDLLINQAYAKSREHERNNAKVSLQLMLGVDWISTEEVEKFNASSTPVVNKPSDQQEGVLLSARKHLVRKVGDLSFYKVVAYLLKNAPTALVIENAQYCDELSWSELRLILLGKDLNLSALITMKANSSSIANSATISCHSISERFKLSSRSGSVQNLQRTATLNRISLTASVKTVSIVSSANKDNSPSCAKLEVKEKSPLSISNPAIDNVQPNSLSSRTTVTMWAPSRTTSETSSAESPMISSPEKPDDSPCGLSPNKAVKTPGRNLDRLSSFFTNRLETITPGSFYVSGGTAPRSGLTSVSFDSYATPDASSPIRFMDSYRSPDKTARKRLGTMHSIPKQSVPSAATAKVDQSPFKEAAAKFGLDFIPAEACRFILDSTQTTIVKIAGLTEEEVHDMLCAALSVEHISADLVKLVLDISSGNAFWCKQIVRFISEQGVEAMERTIKFGLSRHNPLKLLILLRLERLSTEQQLILKVASIIGEEFSQKLLVTLLPKIMAVNANVTESLQALIEHDFLCKVQEHPVELFGFQNQIIQSTLYELLPPSDSAVVHLAIAEFIEREHAQDLHSQYASLAYHFRSASNKRGEACKYAVKSADYALSRGAFNDGLIFALAATEMADTRAENRMLLQVVDIALLELQERGMVEDFVVLDSDEEIWTYETLKQRLQQQIGKMKAARQLSVMLPVEEMDSPAISVNHIRPESLDSPSQRLIDGSCCSPQRSPLSPIHLSWKPSFATLFKLSQDNAAAESALQDGGMLDPSNQAACCTIC